MPEPKTQRNKASVSAFIAAVEDETRRKDAKAVDKMMREITGEKPAMWGTSIVGYGNYPSRSGDWPITGFSPRKDALTLYIMPGFTEQAALMKKLGKHKIGKACLYINKLADVDESVLRELITRSVKWMREKYKPS
ncbi:MAG: DUF1801 domain-containing protein [Hyphomonadaceae bacterium]